MNSNECLFIQAYGSASEFLHPALHRTRLSKLAFHKMCNGIPTPTNQFEKPQPQEFHSPATEKHTRPFTCMMIFSKTRRNFWRDSVARQDFMRHTGQPSPHLRFSGITIVGFKTEQGILRHCRRLRPVIVLEKSDGDTYLGYFPQSG